MNCLRVARKMGWGANQSKRAGGHLTPWPCCHPETGSTCCFHFLIHLRRRPQCHWAGAPDLWAKPLLSLSGMSNLY